MIKLRSDKPARIDCSISGKGPIRSALGILSLFSTKNLTSPSKLESLEQTCVHVLDIRCSSKNSSFEDDDVLNQGSSSSCNRFKCLEQFVHARMFEKVEKLGITIIIDNIHFEQNWRAQRIQANRFLLDISV